MKKKQRLAVILTAAVLALAPCSAAVTAFAADDNSITIESATPDAEHNYNAYQIFKGTLSGEGTEGSPYVLSNLDWGDNAAADFLTKLKADPAFNLVPGETETDPKTSIFAKATTAQDVADVLGQYNNNSDVAIAFAKFAGNNLKEKEDEAPKGTDNEAPYQIGSLAAGYYLIKDEADLDEEDSARTLNLLRVAGKVSFKTKEDLPSIDKLIDEKGGVEANTASIGDVVPYIIKSKVPNMQGYTKYFFVLNDTLSAGLDFNNDVKIEVGGTPLKVDTDYTVEVTGTTSMEIVFRDFYKNFNDNAGDDIIVTYSATVNSNADMTQTGNVNTAQLTYSNDPNEDAQPDTNPDKPSSNSPTGKTPQEKTVTYVTQIDLLKTDNATPAKNLKNAVFKLEGYQKTVAVADGTYYMEDENGEYYRLKDGTFTLITDFEEGTDEYYESTHKKYKVVEASAITEESGSKISMEKPTDDNGKLTFSGLGEGVYTITEIKAPDGFNLLASPITVTITADAKITGCTWGKDVDDPNHATSVSDFVQGNTTGDESMLPLTVVNKPGNTLPSTGGIGTKLFYLFGGMLAIGSGVLLVTKKRVGKEEQ